VGLAAGCRALWRPELGRGDSTAHATASAALPLESADYVGKS